VLVVVVERGEGERDVCVGLKFNCKKRKKVGFQRHEAGAPVCSEGVLGRVLACEKKQWKGIRGFFCV
jgi:hypothetical protein